MRRDEYYLRFAINQAKKAAEKKEVPVGAVIVRDDIIVATGHNRRESKRSPIAHAETEVIQIAAAKSGDWRLSDCELFVTLEPCAMCAGAIISGRIKRLVFGAFDPAAGCMGSVVDLSLLFSEHPIEVLGGVLQQECQRLLTDFFGQRRNL